MVHVRAEKAAVPEGIDLPLDKDSDHDQNRYKKGKEKGGFLQHCGFLTVFQSCHNKVTAFLVFLVYEALSEGSVLA